MSFRVFVSSWNAWAPGIESREDWLAWARGEKSIEVSSKAPSISHVDAMFKRRLSQLTRMTLHVGHEALEGKPSMRMVFASMAGEINQQYKITERLIEDGEVSPSNFSLSVFNTPVAALSITEKSTKGYTACYPGDDVFATGFLEAASSILSGTEQDVLFIVADEAVPDAYASLCDGRAIPYAIAFVLSCEPKGIAVPVSSGDLEQYRVRGGKDGTSRNEVDLENLPEALRFARCVLLSESAVLPGSV